MSEFNQKDLNSEIEQYKIFTTPQKPLYHYTSREVFWKILEGESFLARHILFSNDSEENRIGTTKIKKAMSKIGLTLAESDALPFMICFCEKEDLLSQWRGYANEGVAFEFDFSKGLYGAQEGFSSYYCYTIMNANGERGYLSKGEDETVSYIMAAIASPYGVTYTGKTGKFDEEIANKIKNNPNQQQYAVSMIPYIKDENFHEEREYRLIFDMRKLIAGKESLLEEKYVYLDVNGIKKPNIRVRLGNQDRADHEEETTIYYSSQDLADELEKFRTDMAREGLIIHLVNEQRKFPMKRNEVLLSEGKYQKRICNGLRNRLRPQNTKIWCDGHMPIRKILIGPSKDAELMKASVEEYKKTKYWLKDAEVKISKIPLRI